MARKRRRSNSRVIWIVLGVVAFLAGYLPMQAYVVRGDAALARSLSSRAWVRWVGGLPVMYLPGGVLFTFLMSRAGGYDGGCTLHDGHMQIEQFALQSSKNAVRVGKERLWHRLVRIFLWAQRQKSAEEVYSIVFCSL